MAEIVIPETLRPHDGRFGSGPSKVRPEAVLALADTSAGFLGTSHRRPTVRNVVGRVREGMRTLFSLPDGYEVLLGNGGTTAFWDAASFGLIEQRSQHVTIGEFSSKFATVIKKAPHLDAPDIIDTAPGLVPAPCRATDGIDAYCFPHNETSTGAVCEVRRPDGTTGDDALVLVDATSAAGGLRVDPHEFDVYYFAPQKCFGSDGGLWIALCSPAAVTRIEKITAGDRWRPASLDLGIALDQSRLDQTYNTPALTTLFLLAHTVEWMLAVGGLEGCAQRCDESAGIVYGWAEAHPHATPFVADAARSNVTATIDFDASIDAERVVAALRANGILDVDPYRKLGRNQLRIALFPAIDPDDVARLTRCVDFVIEQLDAS
ncbi:MAG TPA: phosphoserine transaminase [Acidimicrobiia bacterium]